ncbi:MAG: TonB-dependent receptor, partial [Cytophagales bacterium]|nr:TonB-dependent receptor [Cytophagales bacterium]
VSVGNRTSIDVGLAPDIKSLSEVVVIGYGTRERKDLTGAIGSIKAEEIRALPIASPDQALQGRIPGVQITAVSGDPGARQVVRIRGVGTTGNNEPLYVIDGIPVAETRDGNLQRGQNPLSLINPNDIESIDVLKDASAAAIYGLRASNGVILITTKRGKAGKVVANFSARKGFQQMPRFIDNLSTPEYTGLIGEIYGNANETAKLPVDFPGDLLSRTETVDWQRALYNENAPIDDYHLSVGGGSENATFNVSGGFFRQESILQQRGLKRYSLGVNSDFKAGKIFRFGESLRIGYTDQNNAGTGSFGDASRTPPIQRIYNPANATGFEFANFNTGGAGRTQNWLARNSLIESNEYSLRTLGGVYAEIEPIRGLRIRGNVQADFNLNRNIGFRLNDTDYFGSVTQTNQFGDGYLQTFNLLREVLVYFDRSFGNHNVSLLGGATTQRFDLWGMGAGANNLPFAAEEQRFFANAPEADQGRAENFRNYWTLQGYIGRASYNFNNKYYVDATVRRDGSSRFAPENRWGIFPSFSGAWRVSSESFMETVPVLTDLKIRAGWGQLGNQDTQEFAYLSTVNLRQQYFFNGVRVSGAALNRIPNRELGWETSTTTNLGFDAAALDNRLTLTADFFIKNTDDILIDVPIPRAAGLENTTINAVSVQNKGIELALGYAGSVGKDFKYTASGNITFQKNAVTSLGDKGEPFTLDENRTELNRPVGYFYGYQTDGVFQDEGEVDAYEQAISDNVSNEAAPGDIRFKDVNGPKPEDSPRGVYFSGVPDGNVDFNDRTYLGKAIPDYFYGFDLGASYKGIDLSIFFQGVGGVQLINQVRRTGESMAGGSNQWASVRDRWTGPGTSDDMPRAILNDPNSNNRFSNRWVEDAGFLRLKNLQIGYNVPQNLLGKTGGVVSNFRIYVSATNLLTFTKY